LWFAVNIGYNLDDSSEPMQVICGAIGRERVDFEAPKAARLQADLDARG